MQRSIAPILLAAALTGCGSALKSWRVQPPPPTQVVTQQHPERIRVTRSDGTKVVLSHPTVIDDSLVAVDASKRRIALPLTQVQRVEVERTDGGKVAFAVIGGVGGAVLVIILFGNAVGNAAY